MLSRSLPVCCTPNYWIWGCDIVRWAETTQRGSGRLSGRDMRAPWGLRVALLGLVGLANSVRYVRVNVDMLCVRLAGQEGHRRPDNGHARRA